MKKNASHKNKYKIPPVFSIPYRYIGTKITKPDARQAIKIRGSHPNKSWKRPRTNDRPEAHLMNLTALARSFRETTAIFTPYRRKSG
jgi:hypothetical protein